MKKCHCVSLCSYFCNFECVCTVCCLKCQHLVCFDMESFNWNVNVRYSNNCCHLPSGKHNICPITFTSEFSIGIAHKTSLRTTPTHLHSISEMKRNNLTHIYCLKSFSLEMLAWMRVVNETTFRKLVFIFFSSYEQKEKNDFQNTFELDQGEVYLSVHTFFSYLLHTHTLSLHIPLIRKVCNFSASHTWVRKWLPATSRLKSFSYKILRRLSLWLECVQFYFNTKIRFIFFSIYSNKFCVRLFYASMISSSNGIMHMPINDVMDGEKQVKEKSIKSTWSPLNKLSYKLI